MIAPSVSSDSASRLAASRSTVDVFGVRWPRYKAESVVAAALMLGLMLLLTAVIGLSTPAPAVLIAAGTGTAVWWLGRLTHRRPTP